MKTQQLFNEIISKGYDAEVVSMFSYEIHKDRRFKLIVIKSQPTVELFSLAMNYKAHIIVDVIVDSNTRKSSVVYGVYPKDPADYDWVTYNVYYNDNVNEPVLLGTAYTLPEAQEIAKREAIGHGRVLEGDNVDVFASASTARIEVYEGEMVTIVDDEPQLNDAVYATPYFYVN